MAPKTAKKGVAKPVGPEKKTKAKTTKSPRETRTDFSDLPDDYKKWVNDDLKDLCRQRSLAVGGNKATLVDRLTINDELRAGKVDDDGENEDEAPVENPAKAPAKKSAASGTKSSGPKKIPRNAFKTSGGEKKTVPAEEPTPSPPRQAKQSEIDRAKQYYDRIWSIVTTIHGENEGDEVFDAVLLGLDRAKSELKSIKDAVAVSEKAPEKDEEDFGELNEEDSDEDKEDEEPSPSPPSKRLREDVESDEDQAGDSDSERASKSPKLDEEEEGESEEE